MKLFTFFSADNMEAIYVYHTNTDEAIRLANKRSADEGVGNVYNTYSEISFNPDFEREPPGVLEYYDYGK